MEAQLVRRKDHADTPKQCEQWTQQPTYIAAYIGDRRTEPPPCYSGVVPLMLTLFARFWAFGENNAMSSFIRPYKGEDLLNQGTEDKAYSITSRLRH